MPLASGRLTHRPLRPCVCRRPRELANAIDRFDAGAMGAHELLYAERLQLCGSPGEMLVVGGKQMQSADHRSYRRRVDRLARAPEC